MKSIQYGFGEEASSEVYFSDEPIFGAADLIAVTMGTEAQAPPVAKEHSYYWQVVASNVMGVATGQISSFTTWESGPMDHFECTLAGTNLQMTVPFDVTVRATDAYGTLITDYTNRTELTGFRESGLN